MEYLIEVSEELAKRMLDPEVEHVGIREVRGVRENLPQCVMNNAWVQDLDGTKLGVDVFWDEETERWLVGLSHDQFKRIVERNPEIHTTFGMVVM